MNPFVARLNVTLVPQTFGTLYWDLWKSRMSHAYAFRESMEVLDWNPYALGQNVNYESWGVL